MYVDTAICMCPVGWPIPVRGVEIGTEVRALRWAHYTRFPRPGRPTTASNVAALLEVVRAQRAGPQPRNDVGVLFTEREEAGPAHGAKAFDGLARGGRTANRVVV
jgi:hypothetical protein